jgi:hypothetical protein
MPDSKVAEHILAVRRRMEEVQMFAGLVISQTYDPVNENSVLEWLGNIQEIPVLARSASAEIKEMCSFLGLKTEW